MTSIQTNASAIAALRTLTSVDAALASTQSEIASGLRVSTASDNAAYWSISTTMRSDSRALSTVEDALGLTAAIADTTSLALGQVGQQLSDFMAKLVAAKEPGVDKTKIQSELDQIKSGIKDAVQSASFNGVNWLDTNLADVNDTSSNYQNIPWSTGRLQDGDFQVQTRKVVVGALSLFNDPEGGLLKADGQDMASVGGMRNWGATTYNPATDSYDMGWQSDNRRAGSAGMIQYTFSGPLTFANASDQISFDVVVDKDNPADVPGPWNAGSSPKTVTINKALVESVLPSSGGVVKDATDFATVLNSALNTAGTGAMATPNWDYATNNFSKTKYYVQTREDRSSGLTGSYVEISNFTSNVGSGGMFSASDFGSRGSQMTMTFASFTDFKDAQAPGGVSVNFDFGVDGAQKHYSFDRAYVNATLGKTDGSVATADEMVTLLQSLLSTDWPHVIISKDSASQISLTSDNNFDRLAGSGSSIGFSNIVVSNEPRATLDLESIDIAANPSKLDSYIDYIDLVSKNITDAAATVGAMQKSVSLQSDFVLRLKVTIDKGIGRLVDADMTVASTRQKALETRQQLAIQSLQIANAQPSSLLTLFRP